MKCVTFENNFFEMTKHKVGIVCGGYSSEYKISMKSGQTVFDALSPED